MLQNITLEKDKPVGRTKGNKGKTPHLTRNFLHSFSAKNINKENIMNNNLKHQYTERLTYFLNRATTLLPNTTSESEVFDVALNLVILDDMKFNGLRPNFTSTDEVTLAVLEYEYSIISKHNIKSMLALSIADGINQFRKYVKKQEGEL